MTSSCGQNRNLCKLRARIFVRKCQNDGNDRSIHSGVDVSDAHAQGYIDDSEGRGVILG
jgi:hypothetical protein